MLLHGWEGSADSTYLLSLAQSLFAADYEVVRLNLRDHGATHHLNRELFHSCRLPEVVGAVRTLATKFDRPADGAGGIFPGRKFHAARGRGTRRADSCRSSACIAISPVLDPAATLFTLERGLPIYHSYFVRKWSRSLAKKQLAWPDHYDFDELLRIRNLREMTRQLVLSHTEYPLDGRLPRGLRHHG